MNTLEQQLVTLKQARASGVLRVRDGDTDVIYRSVGELNTAIAAVTRELQQRRGLFRVHPVHVSKIV